MLLFRQGVIWRKLHILPLARLQSIRIDQGPLLRALDLASATAHTVPGPVIAKLPAMARDEAVRMFDAASAAIVVAQSTDRSHRWASFDPGHQPVEAQATAPYLGEPVVQPGAEPTPPADPEPSPEQRPSPSAALPTTDHDRRTT
jgi:putative membrane protein